MVGNVRTVKAGYRQMLLQRITDKREKVGVIVVGGSPVDSIQYELIQKQFDCMAHYLSWDMLFQKSYYATAKDELSKNAGAMEDLEKLGAELA